ncbi:MAG: ABC-2 family transporter protein [Chloroherpetonaceae bacterium]|nr:ABC-2 family transporter protein [Chloroherpetonaceae bacterium]
MVTKKYWWVYRTSLRRFVEYRSELFIDLLGKLFIPITVQVVLWSAIFESDSKAEIGGYSYLQMVRYVVMSLLIANLMRVDRIEREIAASIRDGDLSRFLIKPIDFMTYQFTAFLADVTPVFAGFFVLYLGSLVIGVVELNGYAVSIAFITLLVGMYLSYMMGFLIALFAFMMDEIWTLFVMKGLLFWFITGQILPLDFLPKPLFETLSFLPFQFLSYFPAKAFLGQLSTESLNLGLLLSLVWSMIFYAAYRLIWKLSIHRYAAFGG